MFYRIVTKICGEFFIFLFSFKLKTNIKLDRINGSENWCRLHIMQNIIAMKME